MYRNVEYLEKLTDLEMESIIDLSSRENYLAWKSKIKQEYKDLSIQIRKEKSKRKMNSDSYCSSAQGNCFYLRGQARSMCFIRLKGKELSIKKKKVLVD